MDEQPVPPGTWKVPSGAPTSTINSALTLAGEHFAATGQRGTVQFADAGTFILTETLVIPANVEVIAGTALFTSAHPGLMVVNSKAGCTGSYTAAGGWTWSGGRFDAASLSPGAFAVAHCPSAAISGTTIWNTRLKGHGIEVNSSGGPPSPKRVDGMASDDFTIRIVGCHFRGVVQRRPTDCDEAVHVDYSWPGATDGVTGDGTVCNNVLVSGCTFDRSGPTTASYSVGFGAHKFSVAPDEGEPAPAALHSHIRIEGNTFRDVRPIDVGNQRGAVHLRGMTQVVVTGNTFTRCAYGITMEPITLPEHYGRPSFILVTWNTFSSCGSASNTRWCLTDSTGGGTHSGTHWRECHFVSNTFTGVVPANQTAHLLSGAAVDGLWVLNNRFWGLRGPSPLVARQGNRIHGTPADPPGDSTSMSLSGNTWAAEASGAGAVTANT